MKKILFVICAALSFLVFKGEAFAEEHIKLKQQNWSFQGPFGTYDRSALRRGYKVYKQVCSACHSMDFVHFRNLADKGGPEFTLGQVKTLAAEYKVEDGPNNLGEMFERPGLPKDTLPSPYPHEEAARAAQGGAFPPDLSLIVQAREGGANYVYSLLTGFTTPPKDAAGEDPSASHPGLHYNPYFQAGEGWIAMPPPLSDGLVSFDDGSPSDIDSLARDVVQFLAWTADPKLEQRHRLGFQVVTYLALLAVLLYLSVRKLWKDKH